MTSRSLQDIVMLCVDRYVERRWTLRDCLDRYPEHAVEITEMLSLCDDLSAHAPEPMNRQELAVGEQELIAELDRYVAARRGRFSLGSLLTGLGTAAVKSRIAVAASALMVLILAGGSVSLAATFSGPESVLYDYKLVLEQVQVELAPEADKPRLYMQMAERRLDELENLAEGAASEVYRKIARNYDAFVSSGLATLQDLSSANTGVPGTQFADSRRDYLEELGDHRDRLETFAEEKPAYTEEAQGLIVLADASLESVPTEPPEPIAQTIVTATPAPDQFGIVPDAGESTDGGVGGSDESAGTVSTDTVPEGDTAPAPTPTPVPSPTPDLLALPQTEIHGTVTALGTTALIVDGRRVIADTRLAPGLLVIGFPVVGSTVTVTGVVRDDGTVVATAIRVEVVRPTPSPTPTQTPVNTPTLTETPTPTETPTQTMTPTPGPVESLEPGGARFATNGLVVELSPDEMVVGDLTISLEAGEDGEPVLITGGELVVGATVQVDGQVLAGNVLVATTVVVEAPPVDGDEPEGAVPDGGDADGGATPTPTAESDGTPTPDPTPAVDTSPTPAEPDEVTATPTPDPEDETTATPTPTATGTPDANATPTPVVESDLTTITGEVEEFGEDFIQINGQIFQIVAGDDGTLMGVTPEMGAVVTVWLEVQADGTLVAISIVEGAESDPTPTPTPSDPPEVEGTSEATGDEA
jgi:hypothetical protein